MSGQGGVRSPRQPSSKTRSIQGTYPFVCGSPPCDADLPDLQYHTFRLTGSLALSIAYGIRADTPDNKFIRVYEEMLKSAQKGLVPGTFLVDIIPPRRCDPLSVDWEGTLIDDALSQSSIYLRGFLVCNSTRSQVKLRRPCTWLWIVP